MGWLCSDDLLLPGALRAVAECFSRRKDIQALYGDAIWIDENDGVRGYKKEIDFRRLMGYPPFCNLVQILITDGDASKAARTADKIAQAFKLHIAKIEAGSRPHILGPAAAPLEKLRGNYRMQILVKIPAGSNAWQILQDCFADLDRQKISSKIHVDVDPVSLL